MATDFSSRSKPPVLKRFAYLDIDGVPKPERDIAPKAPPSAATKASTPAPRPITAPAQVTPASASQDVDRDVRDFQALADDLNANVRDTKPHQGSGPRSRFTMPMPDNEANARRAQRAAEIRAQRPPDPAYFTRREREVTMVEEPPRSAQRAAQRTPSVAPTMTRSTVTVPLRGERAPTPARRETPSAQGNVPLWQLEVAPSVPSARRAPRLELDDNDFGDDFGDGFATPGVMTVEMSPRNRAATRGRPAVAMVPIELTAMAARQIMLMSWEAGVPGSPLRILTSNTPGLGRPEIDFAFDEHIASDDLVFETQGVTVVVDPDSLRWVQGRRISWHEVPGSEGFRLA